MMVMLMIVMEKVIPAATSPSVLEGNNNAEKYLTAFDVDSNKMAAVSKVENSLFRVRRL